MRSSRLLSIGSLLVVLCAWEGASQIWDLVALPGPIAVGGALADGLRSGELGADAAASLGRVAVGYGLAAGLGLGFGALAGLSGPWGAPARQLVNFLRPIPPIAWVPLAILWFGLGDPSARFIVFVGAFFPIAIQVTWALSQPLPEYMELARSLGASRWIVLTRVRLPAAAPALAAGLRTGLGLAWTSVIAAELVGAQSGLGYRIQLHRLVLQTDGVLAGMVCIGALGFAMDRAARGLEDSVRRWGGA